MPSWLRISAGVAVLASGLAYAPASMLLPYKHTYSRASRAVPHSVILRCSADEDPSKASNEVPRLIRPPARSAGAAAAAAATAGAAARSVKRRAGGDKPAVAGAGDGGSHMTPRTVEDFNREILRLGNLGHADEVLNRLAEMQRRGLAPTTVSWNAAINALTHTGECQQALDMFERVFGGEAGRAHDKMRPDSFSYVAAISACVKGRMPAKAVEYFEVCAQDLCSLPSPRRAYNANDDICTLPRSRALSLARSHTCTSASLQIIPPHWAGHGEAEQGGTSERRVHLQCPEEEDQHADFRRSGARAVGERRHQRRGRRVARSIARQQRERGRGPVRHVIAMNLAPSLVQRRPGNRFTVSRQHSA